MTPPRPSPQQLAVSAVAGLASALIAYSALFVRGDLGGVMAYLRERGALRRLEAAGADAAALSAARAHLRELGQRVGDPAFAAQTLPLALLLGLVVAVLAWRFFGRRERAQARPDIQERMLLRLAHRLGGRFTLGQLHEISPLTEAQAREVTARMVERGQLQRDGEGYRLS